MELEDVHRLAVRGQKYPNTVAHLPGRVGPVHPVPGVPARAAPGDLHDQLIESLNYQLRKIIKNRGHFPSDDAVVKLLWLAICNIEDKRARERAKERGRGRNAKRKAEGRLVEGQITTNWKQALAQLTLAYPERINPHL